MSQMQMPDTPSAREFLERELRAEPNLTYEQVRQRASAIGINVPPFLFGSMRRQLGIATAGPAEAATPASRSHRADSAATVVSEEPFEAGGDEDDADADAGDADAADGGGDTFATSFADDDVDDGDDGDDAGDDAGDQREMAGAADDDRDEGAGRERAVDAPPRKPAATEGKQSPFEFAREVLQMSPEITYQDLKLRGRMAGIKIPPIVYGRAKALLGLVPMKPRKPRKQEIEAPRSLQQVDSAKGFVPSRSPDISGLEFVEQLVATVRQLEAERNQLRDALHEVLDLVRDALD